MGVLMAAGLTGAAFSPVLAVKSPLLLLTLSPDVRHVALVAGSVVPWLLFPVVVVRRTLFSLACYGIGAVYGSAAVAWVRRRHPRASKVLNFLERIFQRFGAALFAVLPLASLCVLAGAARTRFSGFLPAIVVGHTLWIAAFYWLGAAISVWTAKLLEFLSEHLVESTLFCVIAVVLWQVRSRWSRRPRAQA